MDLKSVVSPKISAVVLKKLATEVIFEVLKAPIELIFRALKSAVEKTST